jgi:hypothetical protein
VEASVNLGLICEYHHWRCIHFLLWIFDRDLHEKRSIYAGFWRLKRAGFAQFCPLNQAHESKLGRAGRRIWVCLSLVKVPVPEPQVLAQTNKNLCDQEGKMNGFAFVRLSTQ